MVQVNINFSNKTFYTIITILSIALITGVVFALTPGVAPNPGHLTAQISPPTGCTAGQALKWDGTNIVCGTVASTSACHWEKSWVTYTTIGVEGAEITRGDNSNEKTSCNFGQCQLKADSASCDPSLSSCTTTSSIVGCGRKTPDKNEYLYCCG